MTKKTRRGAEINLFAFLPYSLRPDYTYFEDNFLHFSGSLPISKGGVLGP